MLFYFTLIITCPVFTLCDPFIVDFDGSNPFIPVSVFAKAYSDALMYQNMLDVLQMYLIFI